MMKYRILFLSLLLSLLSSTTYATTTFLRRQQKLTKKESTFLSDEPASSKLDEQRKEVEMEEKEDDQLDAQEALAMEKEAGEEGDKADLTPEESEEQEEPTISNDEFQSLDTEATLKDDGPIPEPDQFPIQPKAATAATGGIAAIFGTPLGAASTGGTGGTGGTGDATGSATGGATGGMTGGASTTTGSTGTEKGLDLNNVEIEVNDEKRLHDNIKALLNGSPRVQAAYAKFEKAAARARQILDLMKGINEMNSMSTSTGTTGSTGSTGGATSGKTGSAATGNGATATEETVSPSSTPAGEIMTEPKQAGDTSSLLETLIHDMTGATGATGATGGAIGTASGTGSTSTGMATGGTGAIGGLFIPPIESSDEVETCTQIIEPTLFGIHERIAKDFLSSEKVNKNLATLPKDINEVDTILNHLILAEKRDVDESLAVCRQKCPYDPAKKMGVMEKFLAKIAKLKEQCGPELNKETTRFVNDLNNLVKSIDVSIAGDGKNASLLSDIGLNRQKEKIASVKAARFAAEKRKEMLKEYVFFAIFYLLLILFELLTIFPPFLFSSAVLGD
jgi:hypothetical protein